MDHLINMGCKAVPNHLECSDRPILPVEVMDPNNFSGWDSALRATGVQTFFHCAAWAKVLRESYGYTPMYFVMRQQGRMEALFPVMEVKSLITGVRGVSLPFTDSCPPVAEDADTFRVLLNEAITCGQMRKWRYLEWRGGHDLLPGVNPSGPYYEHFLELSEEKKAFARMKPEVRTAVRRAAREAVSVKVDETPIGLREFYRLHCGTRRKHGLPPQPLSFFQKIWEHIVHAGLGSVFLAYRNETPIAAAMFFHFAGQVIFKYGASDQRFQHLRPNNLLFWDAIKDFGRQGYEIMSLGRTSIYEEGLRRFKVGLGAAEEKRYYFRYDIEKSEFGICVDKALGWYNTAFRCLPPSASRLVGKLLYRHLG